MLVSDEKRLRWLGLDMRARWRRRVAVVLVYLIYVLAMEWIPNNAGPLYRYWMMYGVSAVVALAGLFGDRRLVKSFDEPRIRKGQFTIVSSLNDWAEYDYEREFEELTEEQQAELLSRYRVGNYARPYRRMRGPEEPDEREVGERNWAAYRALQFVALMLVNMAMQRHLHESDAMLRSTFLLLAVVALTLPKAIILWTEDDPRVVGGEMEVVKREA